MTWAVATLGLVLVGVFFLLTTLRSIGRAHDEASHYLVSVRFWLGLAVFGVVVVGVLWLPLLSHPFASTDAGMVSAGLIAILPTIVVAAGLRNAFVLLRAHRRRRGAFAAGGLVNARVVERRRWPLGQDLMALVVEADVPDATPQSDMAYRSRRPDRTARHRFVEMCPGDHWSRFSPGAAVTLHYDPADLRRFAVLLFAETPDAA